MANPIKSVSRFSRAQRSEITAPQPHLLHQYNQYMGGFDLHDAFVSSYRVNIRSKKWWWPLFSHLIDSKIVNVWLIYTNISSSFQISCCKINNDNKNFSNWWTSSSKKKVGLPVTFQQADLMERYTILQKVTHEDDAKFFKARLFFLVCLLYTSPSPRD